MPIEVSKEEVLQSLGKLAGGAATGATEQAVGAPSTITLQLTTKAIDLVAKHLDRVLDRFNPPRPVEKASATPKTQLLEKEKTKAIKVGEKIAGAKPKPERNINAEQIVEGFQVFMGMQNQQLTLGQFGAWIQENKPAMIKVIDVALKRM